jgi:hypothetical protein
MLFHGSLFDHAAAQPRPCRHPAETMYIVLSKKPRKTNRTKSKRYRAKLKSKDRGRRGRVYQLNK